MHHLKDRITHTTAFVTPVVEHWLEREIAQCVHSYHGATSRSHAIWTLQPHCDVYDDGRLLIKYSYAFVILLFIVQFLVIFI